MKKQLFYFLATVSLIFVISINANAQLNVDFDAATTQAVGYLSFKNVVDSDPSKFTDSIFSSVSIGGTTKDITVRLSVTSGIVGGNFAFRTNPVNNAFSTPSKELVNDLIGINAGNSDSLFVKITGLPAGKYKWKSYHHYPWNSTFSGKLNLIIFNGGLPVDSVLNVSHSGYSNGAVGSAFTIFEADGTNPVIVAITNTASAASWILMSGFDLEGVSSENDITGFTLAEQTGTGANDTINATDHTVIIEVNQGTDVSKLTPAITVSDDATITPASGTEQDFTNPFEYTVKAENGDEQKWTVTVALAPSSDNDITGFTLAEQTGTGANDTINATDHTVVIEVKHGTDIGKLTPSITVSGGATITPASGTEHDFTNPFEYTVKAQNGDEQKWNVTVTVESDLHTSINGSDWVSNDWNWNLGEFSPGDTLTLLLTGNSSGDVSVNLGLFAPWDFIEKRVDSVVTDLFVKDTIEVEIVIPDTAKSYDYLISEKGYASDGYWVIQAVEADGKYCNFKFFVNDNNNITKFSLVEQTGDATINDSDSTIAIEVKAGTGVTKLTPTIEVDAGATISPASGTEHDFTNPVKYTVTGKNGAVKEWVITVTEAVVSAKDIFANVVKIYPNPSNGQVNIDLSKLDREVSIYIINSVGNTVYSNESASSIITLNKLNSGMYLVNIEGQAFKLIVE